MTVKTLNGFQIATGISANVAAENANPFNTDVVEKPSSNTDPNIYALAALAMAVIGLLLTLARHKTAFGSALMAGVIGAASLIGLMIDVHRKVQAKIPSIPDLDGNQGMGVDAPKISVDFGPGLYVCILLFLVAAFFCYKRIKGK